MTLLVLDTNVLLSALLFRGSASCLVPLWKGGRFRLAVSREILEEYARALAYPKFDLEESTVQALLQQCVLPFCEMVEAAPGAPACRDPDDDQFLFCALSARAEAVVSGDRDLLALAPEYHGIAILMVAEALGRYGRPVEEG